MSPRSSCWSSMVDGYQFDLHVTRTATASAEAGIRRRRSCRLEGGSVPSLAPSRESSISIPRGATGYGAGARTRRAN